MTSSRTAQYYIWLFHRLDIGSKYRNHYKARNLSHTHQIERHKAHVRIYLHLCMCHTQLSSIYRQCLVWGQICHKFIFYSEENLIFLRRCPKPSLLITLSKQALWGLGVSVWYGPGLELIRNIHQLKMAIIRTTVFVVDCRREMASGLFLKPIKYRYQYPPRDWDYFQAEWHLTSVPCAP